MDYLHFKQQGGQHLPECHTAFSNHMENHSGFLPVEGVSLFRIIQTVDGTVAGKVGAKNELRKTILKTHNALINILKANYPDTYKSVLREWGFQKEKY